MNNSMIIDGHIHLWHESASNENGHAWMTPGMPLAKQHILQDYQSASGDNKAIKGVVYVETDRRYDTPRGDISTWATGPLDEIRFVRSIVEGGYGEQDSKLLIGIVLWAPMDQKPDVLESWLRVAEENAGPETWKRVKGFRFLLQAIHDQEEFRRLVLSRDFIANLQILGRQGFSFDVGVDQHSGGLWQLDLVLQSMELAHTAVDDASKVTFILNHLCKPDFSNETEGSGSHAEFAGWKHAIEQLARVSKTYMKLSGAFSELPSGFTEPASIAAHIEPWVRHVINAFGPKRVLFGSDWPICNVKGPFQEGSWVSWREVVELLLQDSSLQDTDRQRVWSETAAEAYRLR